MTFPISTFPCPAGGFMRWARLAGPIPCKGCVIIMMGWGEWLEKYNATAVEWHKRGFETVIVEYRGQGLSSRFLENRRKAWLPGFDVLLADFSAFYNQFFAGDASPLLLMGHSMGAHLLLRWFIENSPPELVKGVILLSPMQDIITERFTFSEACKLARAATFLGLGKMFTPGQEKFDPVTIPFENNPLTHDAENYRNMQVALRANPLLKPGGITYGWLNAACASAQKLEQNMKRGAPATSYLILGPEDDPLIEVESMKRIAAYLPNCHSRFFPNAAHELLFETNTICEKLWDEIDAFLEKI